MGWTRDNGDNRFGTIYILILMGIMGIIVIVDIIVIIVIIDLGVSSPFYNRFFAHLMGYNKTKWGNKQDNISDF